MTSEDKGGAVAPLHDCPHIFSAIANPSPAILDNLSHSFQQPCRSCSSSAENWTCLNCYQTFCSRYVAGHQENHFFESLTDPNDQHCIAISHSDLSVWCYVCNAYLKHDRLVPLLIRAESAKFGSEENLKFLQGIATEFPVGLSVSESSCHDHPHRASYEQHLRITAVKSRLEGRGLLRKLRHVAPMEITKNDISLVHDQGYVTFILESGESGQVGSDARASLNASADLFAGPGTASAALSAAGSTVAITRKVCTGEIRSGFALVRPPGHHATRTAAGGFCFFNNVAVAAGVAMREFGLTRILIVDFDIHHGNGTQDIFYNNPQVLHISMHRQQYGDVEGEMAEFTDEGKVNMIGDGAGLGYNVNIPLPQGWLPEPDATLSTTSAVGVSEANAKEASTSAAGTADGPAYRGLGDVDYAELFDRLVTPLARDFKPQLIIAAAGFDAGVGDSALPIGGYSVTPQGFAQMTRTLMQLAPEGKLVMSLEGGYRLGGLADSVEAVIEALLQDQYTIDDTKSSAGLLQPQEQTPPAGGEDQPVAPPVSQSEGDTNTIPISSFVGTELRGAVASPSDTTASHVGSPTGSLAAPALNPVREGVHPGTLETIALVEATFAPHWPCFRHALLSPAAASATTATATVVAAAVADTGAATASSPSIEDSQHSASVADSGSALSLPPPPIKSAPANATVFISLTALARDFRSGVIPDGLLESPSTLFFFGSKRFWLFPTSREQRMESEAQGSTYTELPGQLRGLIMVKEKRGEVFFLKPDTLGIPDVDVVGDYEGASAWLQGLGYNPLLLDSSWWETEFKGGKHLTDGAEVVRNYSAGLHDYPAVLELLQQSDERLRPILSWT